MKPFQVPELFHEAVQLTQQQGLTNQGLAVVQVNTGLKCNQACKHCHVEASPKRTELMSQETMEQILAQLPQFPGVVLDITGGAPEIHPHIRPFIQRAKEQGARVQLRTNLTAPFEPGLEDLPEFFAAQEVALVASLPCYGPDNVNQQRGAGVFEKSIQMLKKLNSLGYGTQPSLSLDLVYNPLKAVLPPAEKALEKDYKERLRQDFGVEFTRLIAITNMPIGSFRSRLEREEKLNDYVTLLRHSFNPATLDGLMCRHQIHVSWDGHLHDCDFNYALGLRLLGGKDHLSQVSFAQLVGRRIATQEHCFGCTAGAGSSCGGALA